MLRSALSPSRRQLQPYALAMMTVFWLASTSAVAEFSATRRSINGTGETLAEGEAEAGLTGIAYGVRDDVQVRVPSVALLVGYARVEVRERFALADAMRLSPYAYLETPRHAGVGVDYGVDFGTEREHSVTVGGRLRHGPLARPGDGAPPVVRHRDVWLPNAEYDYYAAGDLTYVGMSDWLVYVGHTWSFERWQLGLVVSPAAGFLPLPYAYRRF